MLLFSWEDVTACISTRIVKNKSKKNLLFLKLQSCYHWKPMFVFMFCFLFLCLGVNYVFFKMVSRIKSGAKQIYKNRMEWIYVKWVLFIFIWASIWARLYVGVVAIYVDVCKLHQFLIIKHLPKRKEKTYFSQICFIIYSYLFANQNSNWIQVIQI